MRSAPPIVCAAVCMLFAPVPALRGDVYPESLEWPPSLMTVPAKCLALEQRELARHALVEQRGSAARIHLMPTLADVTLTLSTAALDVAVMPRALTYGNDVAVVAESSGIRLASPSADGSEIASELRTGSPYAGATRVQGGTFGVSGLPGLLLVGSDGSTVTVQCATPAGSVAAIALTTTASFTCTDGASQPSPVLDLRFCDWNGDATDASAIAVLTGYGLEVHAADGSILLKKAANPGSGPMSCIAVARHPTGIEGVAWITKNALGNQKIGYESALGSDLTGGLGDTGALAMIPGDVDDDGDDDLLIVRNDSLHLHVVHNLARQQQGVWGPSFRHYSPGDPESFDLIDAYPEGSGLNAAIPAWTPLFDYHVTDDLLAFDVAMPLESLDVIRLLSPSPLPQVSAVSGSANDWPAIAAAYYSNWMTGSASEGSLFLTLVDGWGDMPGKTHLEATVWTAPHEADDVDPVATSRTRFTLQSVASSFTIEVPIPATPAFTSEPSAAQTVTQRFYVEVRALRLNGAVIERVGLSYVWGLALQPDLTFAVNSGPITGLETLLTAEGAGSSLAIFCSHTSCSIENCGGGLTPLVGGEEAGGSEGGDGPHFGASVTSAGIVPQLRIPAGLPLSVPGPPPTKSVNTPMPTCP